MKTRKYKRSDGEVLRIELQPYRGKLSLILIATAIAILVFFPWQWGFSAHPGSRYADGITALMLIFTGFSICGALARNIIQLESGRKIRKGWSVFGLPIWLGSASLSKATEVRLDMSDPDNPILKCLDPSGASILAIEGLRNSHEAEQLAFYLVRQLGDDDTAIHEFVKEFKTGSSSAPRKSIRWGIAGAAFLYGILFAVFDTGTTATSQVVTTAIAVAIAALGLGISLPDDRVTSSDANEGILRGWCRRRIFWIEDYVWDFKISQSPMVTRTRLDRSLIPLGLLLVIYGAIVYFLSSPDLVQSRTENTSNPEMSAEMRELQQKGAEKFEELRRKRDALQDRSPNR